MKQIKHQFRRYLIHTLFRVFVQGTFFAFGALLIYAITESIFLVLIYGVISRFTGVLLKSVGLNLYIRSLKKYGHYLIMVAGLILSAISYLLLFYLSQVSDFSYVLFIASAVLHGIGGSSYWIPATMMSLYFSGNTKMPGKYNAYIEIVRKSAMFLAALTGIVLNLNDNFLLLFIVGVATLLLSMIPLYGIQLPEIKTFTFKDAIKHISWNSFLANINPNHIIRRVAVPLILIFIFGSFSTSVWITGVTIIGTIIASFLSGKLKDSGNKILTRASIIVLPSLWILYGFIFLPFHFVILGILMSIFDTIATTSREARLSREVVNSHIPIEKIIGIEFARSIGGSTGYLILLMILAITSTLPQLSLTIGALFTLPLLIYANGDIQKLNRKNS